MDGYGGQIYQVNLKVSLYFYVLRFTYSYRQIVVLLLSFLLKSTYYISVSLLSKKASIVNVSVGWKRGSRGPRKFHVIKMRHESASILVKFYFRVKIKRDWVSADPESNENVMKFSFWS